MLPNFPIFQIAWIFRDPLSRFCHVSTSIIDALPQIVLSAQDLGKVCCSEVPPNNVKSMVLSTAPNSLLPDTGG